MGSSSRRSNVLYDPIRKTHVELTPEEGVRQHLIKQLIKLGYPPELMVVEKALSELPHLQGKPNIPQRRLDLLCYARSLSPLLLVECKALLLGDIAKRQLIGYNAFVGAPYIALVNRDEAYTGYRERGEWGFIPGLIPYQELTISKDSLSN